MISEVLIPSGVSGNVITIKNMWRLVNQDTKDESLINIATAIVSGIPSNDHFSQFKALFSWIKNNINFITNPTGVQMVQDSFRTIQRRAGACTDHTVLLSSLAQSIGFIVRFKTIMTIPPENGKDSEFQHIYPQVLLDGNWLGADTTEPTSYLGWESPNIYGERTWNNPLLKNVIGSLGLYEVDIITYLNNIISAFNTPVFERTPEQKTLIAGYGPNTTQIALVFTDANTFKYRNQTVITSRGWTIARIDIPKAQVLLNQLSVLQQQEPEKQVQGLYTITLAQQKEIAELNADFEKQGIEADGLVNKINDIAVKITEYQDKGVVLSGLRGLSGLGLFPNIEQMKSIAAGQLRASQSIDLNAQITENNKIIAELRTDKLENEKILQSMRDMVVTYSDLLKRYQNAPVPSTSVPVISVPTASVQSAPVESVQIRDSFGVTAELSKLISDESISKMTEMGIPITDQSVDLMSLTIKDLLSKNPDVIGLMVEPPATVEEAAVGMGKGLTKAQQKKHKAAINAQMDAKNQAMWASTSDAQRESIMANYNASIASIQKTADKNRKVNNQQQIIKGVVAAAAVVTGAILLAPALATGGTASLTAASKLINTSKEMGLSPASLVGSVIPGAADAITNLTGQTPAQISQYADGLLKGNVDDVTSPPVQPPVYEVPVSPSGQTTPAQAGTTTATTTKKPFPIKYVIISGIAVVTIGGIIYFLRKRKR